MAVLVPPRRKLCVHSRPKTIHILQCHFIRSHIRRVQVCVAAVTCHLQLDRIIVCLINLTSRPYVTQSLRHVHVSHHPYATPMCLIILLCYLHVSQHPAVFLACVSSSCFVACMCLDILLLPPCVSTSWCAKCMRLIILIRYRWVSEHPPILLPSVWKSCYVTSMCFSIPLRSRHVSHRHLPLACLLIALTDCLLMILMDCPLMILMPSCVSAS